MYFVAILIAVMAQSKQSAGVLAARIGTGASPDRPYIACRRSDCSVFVGNPVDGPPRWTSTTTIGSSVITASPIASAFSARPGPEVDVTASEPAYAAPMLDVIAAISSSAWKVTTPKSLYCARAWSMSDAGVIG